MSGSIFSGRQRVLLISVLVIAAISLSVFGLTCATDDDSDASPSIRDGNNNIYEVRDNTLFITKGDEGGTGVMGPFSAISTVANISGLSLTGVTEVYIGDGITDIGDHAFFNVLTGSVKVTIGKNVTAIGDKAFSGCTGISQLTVYYNLASYSSVTDEESFDKPFYDMTGSVLAGSDIAGRMFTQSGSAFNEVPVYYDHEGTVSGGINLIGAFGSTSPRSMYSGDMIVPKYVMASSANPDYYIPCTSSQAEYTVTSIGHDYDCDSFFTSVRSAIMSPSVTVVDDYVFWDNSDLLFIDLYNVEELGYCVFDGCTNLRTIHIPSTVRQMDVGTFVGDEYYGGNNGLESITVAEDNTYFQSVDGILFTKNKEGGEYMIYCPSKNGITEYTMPDWVVGVYNSTFVKHTTLKTLDFNNMTSFGNGNNVCRDCTALEYVDLGDSTSIQECTFKNCTSLKTVIMNNVTTFDSYYLSSNGPFYGCNALDITANMTSPSELTQDPFPSGSKIFIPAGTLSAYQSSWAVCSSSSDFYEMIPVPEANTGLVYNGSAQVGVNSGTGYTLTGTFESTDVGTYTATATLISGYVWADGTFDPVDIDWEIAKIPTSITEVPVASATNEGKALSTSTLSGGTASVAGTFAWTDGSQTVTYGTTYEVTFTPTDGNYAASTCAISVPLSSFIDDNGIYYTVSGTTLTISKGTSTDGVVSVPSSYTSIPDWLKNAKGVTDTIQTVNIGDGVTQVSTYTFCNNHTITSLTTYGSVNNVRFHAFYGCDQLSSAILDGTDLKLEGSSFYGCTSLKTVNIGAGVTNIDMTSGSNPFDDALEEFAVDNGNTVYSSIDGILYDKNATILIKAPKSKDIGDFTIPDTVTNIHAHAFFANQGITSVTFTSDSQIIHIAGASFYHCDNLISVTFEGSTLEVIANYSFEYCTNLEKVNIPSTVKNIGEESFKNDSKLCLMVLSGTPCYVDSNDGALEGISKIYVPNGRSSVYKSDSNWGEYESIIFEFIVKPTANTGLIYNGTVKTGVNSGSGYTLSGDYTGTDAGNYSATAALTNSNDVWSDYTNANLSIEWSIAKADYDMSGVILTDASATYDGTVHNAVLSGTLPTGADGIQVTYSLSEGLITVGTKEVTAIFATESTNYNTPASMTANVEVTKRAVTLTSASDSKTYDGTPLTKDSVSITSGSFVSGEGVESYSVTGSRTFVGTSDNTFTYTLKDNTKAGNYNITTVYGGLSVSQRQISVSEPTGSKTKTYDGNVSMPSQTIGTVTGIIDSDVSVVIDQAVFLSKDASKTVQYKVTYKFGSASSLNDNYILPADSTGDGSVTKRLVSLFSRGATKTYDGTALTRNEVYIANGSFADGEGVESYTFGVSITDVGNKTNYFGYSLKSNTNKNNYEITMGFAALSVTARKVTLTSGSDSKTYDGTPLTKDSVSITSGSFVDEQGVETYSVTGSQTYKGTSKNTFTYTLNDNTKAGNYDITTVEGDLTVNAIATQIVITAGSDVKKYDGTALTCDSYTFTQDVLITGDELSAVISGTITNAGIANNNVTSYKVMRGDVNVTDCYTFGTSIPGQLEITKRTVTLTSASDSKTYDGSALTNSTVTVSGDGFITGQGVDSYNVTGSQTYAGSSLNTFTYRLNDETLAGNYVITKSEGELCVVPISTEIVITADSDSKIYDGSALTKGTYTFTQDVLITGDELTAVISGTITDVGTADNVVSSYKVMRCDIDVTSCYTFGTSVKGTLEVTKRAVTLTSGSASKTYDGSALTKNSVSVTSGTFVDGEGVKSYSVTGSQTDAGSSDNSFTYTLKDNTKAGNYVITKVVGTLTVSKAKVTLTSASDSKTYDGTPLTNSAVGEVGFVSGEGVKTYSVTGSQTYAGSSKNTFTYTLKDNTKAGNYEITKVEQNLTVYAIETEIIITADSASKMYDGSALTKGTYSYTKDVIVSGDELTAVINGSITDVGKADNVVSSYKVMRGDVEVTNCYTFGTSVKGTLEVTKRAVTLTSASDSKTYNGTPLTNSNVAVSGDGFVGEEGATYNVTGSQTAVGTSKNTFTYTLKDNTKEGNYDITKVEGDLTVNAATAIIITADSASKMYDGTALTKNSFTYTEGVLIDGDELSAVISGSITDCGTTSNIVSSYKVMRGDVEVTSYYVFGDTVPGTLTITWRTVHLTSASDSKTYDGTPLTNSNVEVTGDGFVGEEGVTYNFTGSQTNAGDSNNTFTYTMKDNTKECNYNIITFYGNLSVSQRQLSVTAPAGDKDKMYDGTVSMPSQTIGTVSGIIDAKVSVVIDTAVYLSKDASDSAAYKVTYKFGTSSDLNANYLVPVDSTGNGQIAKRSVTMTSATDSKVYDGTPLTNSNVEVTGDGFVTGEGATYNVTGSQTFVGTSKNYFTYTLKDNTKEGNYDITKAEGDLTVTPVTSVITITADSGSKMYDGIAFTKGTFTCTAGIIVEGDILTAVVEGTITDVGTADNIVTSYKVMRGDVNVTDHYTFGTSVKGTLEVTKRAVTLTSATDSRAYNGYSLTNSNVDVSGDGFVTGEGATYDVTGYQTFVGSSKNIFTYTLKDNTKAGNYDITTVEGDLTVNAIATQIVITAGSDSKMYDGTALWCGSYTYTQGVIVEGLDVLNVITSGTITNAGTADNMIEAFFVLQGDINVTDCYTFGTPVKGTLEVTKRSVTLTSASDSRTYNGTPLTNSNVAVSGDGFVAGEDATYNVTGSQTVVGTSNNAFTYTLNEGTLEGNYSITTAYGDLTVTPVMTEIVITADDASKMYDGTALTKSTYTFTQGVIVSGDELTAVTSGTITDFGTAVNKIASYKVMREDADVTNCYAMIMTADGTLNITKRSVTLTSGSDSKKYDGTALTNGNITVSGDGFVDGEGMTYENTGSQIDTGSSKNTFSYTAKTGTNPNNYAVTKEEGDLEVTARSVTMTSASGSKVYDRTALTVEAVNITGDGFVSGEGAAYDVTGSQTYPGTSDNEFTYELNSGTKPVNYDVVLVFGKLTVEKRSVAVPEELYYVATGSEITFNIPTSEWYTIEDKPQKGTAVGTYTYKLTLDIGCIWSPADFDGYYNVYITDPAKKHINDEGVTDVIVTSEKGIRGDLTLVVISKSDVKDIEDKFKFDGKAQYSYDVKLMKNDAEVQPDGKITLALLIPDGIDKNAYTVYHIHGGTNEKMDSRTEGDYAIVTTNDLSDFVFVVPETGGFSNTALLIVLGTVCAIVALIMMASVWAKKRRSE